MRYLIILVLLTSSAPAQSMSFSSGRGSFILSGQLQPTLGAETPKPAPVVKAPVSAPVIVPLPPVVQKVMPVRSRRRLVMFTASYCGPCQLWKKSELRKLERMGISVEQIEMTDASNVAKYGSESRGKKRIYRLPAFVVVDWDTGEWVGDQIIGSTPAEQLIPLLHVPDHQPVQSASKCNCSSACTCGCQSGGVCRCSVKATQPVQQPVAAPAMRDPAKRFAVWGGVKYDMETWRRMCSMRSCPMCNYLDNAQAVYFSSTITAAPNPQSSSPIDVVDEAIAVYREAGLGVNDTLAELGSGDGRTAIRIAQATGCRVVGIEIDPAKVVESRQNVQAAGLSGRIEIIEGDATKFNPATYRHPITAVYAYLYPEVLGQLKPQLMYGRIAVVPGHYVEGVGLKSFKQLWVRKSVGGSEGLFGEAGSSHESRESLIQHLMYEGEHRGRHQLTELQQMSDMELNSLHNLDHQNGSYAVQR